MKQYKLKDHVTDEMLVAAGFEPYYDTTAECVTSYSRPYKNNENMVMVGWDNNCSCDKREIDTAFNYDEVDVNEFQDLIKLGYVEEMK